MKILIVDDSALIRDSLKILLGRCKDFDVIGTAADGQEAFELCLKEVPDIVLMDLNMPKVDGVFRNKTDQKPVSQYKGRYFKCLPG